MPEHPLHEAIGKLITNEFEKEQENTKVYADHSKKTDDKIQIPLFVSDRNSHDARYCCVDVLILRDNKIKVIVEIEESNIKPTHICGKYLTSALAKYFIHDKNAQTPIPMSENVTFIQVVDTKKLSSTSKKNIQFTRIENSIQNILPVTGSKIKNYHLIMFDGPTDITAQANLELKIKAAI
jgi:hypothetical protein